jgi:hypothetical protein
MYVLIGIFEVMQQRLNAHGVSSNCTDTGIGLIFFGRLRASYHPDNFTSNRGFSGYVEI